MAPNIRQSIVKTYRFVGIILLVAVLVGLISYLTVNIYYVASRSWVMPELLTANDSRVVTAVTALGDAENRLDELNRERTDTALLIKRVGREVGEAETFLASYGSAISGVASVFDRAMLQRAVSAARIEADAGKERASRLEEELATLDVRIARQKGIIAQWQQSPYLKVSKGNVAVAFVPYRNLGKLTPGISLYSCWAALMFCSKVGTVKGILPGEVLGRSPHDNQVERGIFAEVEVSEAGMRERVLFVGGAPLLF